MIILFLTFRSDLILQSVKETPHDVPIRGKARYRSLFVSQLCSLRLAVRYLSSRKSISFVPRLYTSCGSLTFVSRSLDPRNSSIYWWPVGVALNKSSSVQNQFMLEDRPVKQTLVDGLSMLDGYFGPQLCMGDR
jgi:hypothetical protein